MGKYTLTIVFGADTDEDAKEARNDLMDEAESILPTIDIDTLTREDGTVID